MDCREDSMALRRSTRRSITLTTPSAAGGAATPSSQSSGRRHEHSDDNNDNVSSSGGGGGRSVRLGKHVRAAGGGVGGSMKSEGVASSSGENTGEGRQQGRPTRDKSDSAPGRANKRRRTSDSVGRPSRRYVRRMRLRHRSSSGHRVIKQEKSKFKMEPVRRSTREKRLVFATLNLSEIDKQIQDPKHGYPELDSSEEEMEPYEKLFSPRRVLRQSTRLREKHRDDKVEEGTSKKIKEERTTEGEGEEDENGGDSEQEEKEEGEDSEVSEEEEEEEGEEDEDEGENSEEEEQLEDEAEMTYNLRKRRPVIYQYQPVIQVVDDDTPPKKLHRRRRQSLGGRGQSSYHSKARSAAPRAYQPRRKTSHRGSGEGRKRHVQHHGDSSTTSSGSDSDEARFRRRKARSMAKGRSQCLPMNFAPEDISHGATRDRVRIGASLADIDPMNIDRDVTFDSVGGLQDHIRALKEMIIFPLLYPEVFERFKINPPRGVLFYGPPGCGKTLVARALANECSKGGKKVAFFMRKGADCLSKWVGESERQLRLLFDQAYQLRPSIIFFDEIDGLAPVRSSRQDQIHSSIVSTLLALMDGLDSRGEVVVIGATNRIDAIDPALRRPGRFDREFLFPLPSREDRYKILSIHTRAWSPQLKPDFLSELAESSVGYCGADLRALCTEAALFALRRKYPQIYKTTDKLVLDVASINVAASDFHSALKVIVPTAQRSDASSACAIPEHVRPLLLKTFSSLLSLASFVFPPSWKAVNRAAKDVKILCSLEEDLLKKMNDGLQDMETTQTSIVLSTSKSHGIHHNPSDKKRKVGPLINSSSIGCSSSLHAGSKVKKVKGGRAQDILDGCEPRRQQPSSWSHQHKQQQQQQNSPSTDNWSGNYHRRFGAQDPGRSVSSKDVPSSGGRQLQSRVVGGRDGGDGGKEEEEGEGGEEELSEMFSQLYQSSQASELDKVYFDMKDVQSDEVSGGLSSGSTSILMEQEAGSKETQESGGLAVASMETMCSSNNSQQSMDTHCQLLSQTSTASTSSSSVFSQQRYLSLSSHPHAIPMVHRPRLILCGAEGMGQSSLLSPALLHALEEFPVKTLDLTTVFATSTKTPEEACTQVFREARRVAPSIVYLPRINTWWEVTPETFRATLFSVVYSLPPTTPLLVLATAECPFSRLPGAVRELFKQDCSKVFPVPCPSLDERRRFFYNVLMERPAQLPPPKPTPTADVELEVLPVAPPPKLRELTEGEVDKIEKQREAVLRELRVFLRDATNKLLAERKFKEFAKPVDPEEVPDYYKIITEPMDLGTVMKKIDEHRYTTPKQWISDVDLITRNALEYNPEHDSESRLLRHRAVALQDMAHSFIDHELSEDFEQQCDEIAETYKRLGKDPTLSSPLKKRPGSSTGGAGSSKDGQKNDAISSSIAAAISIKTELYNAPRRSLRQKGLIPEQMGFPYYSPPRPKRTPREKSNPLDDNPGNDPEAISEEAATDGEHNLEHEMSKDGVTVTEEDSQLQRRTSTRRSGRGRSGRGSNTSESSESKKDDSPYQQEPSKSSNPSTSSSSANAGIKVNGSTVADTPKEVRVLNNSHARRQIIRPWEDNTSTNTSTSSSKQILSIDNLHTNSQKKPLHNGTVSTPPPPALTTFTTLTTNPRLLQNEQQDDRGGPSSNDVTTSNSVQTAAEALVEIGQLTPSRNSQEAPVESMELEITKSIPPLSMSVVDGSSSSTSLALGGDSASASLDMPSANGGPKEVVIDRKRQLDLFHDVARATENCSVEQMDRLHSTFEHIVFRHRMTLDKQRLIEDLELASNLFFQTCAMTSSTSGSGHWH